MTEHFSLRQRLAAPEITIAPGVYDALGSVLVQQAGYHVTYLSGASIAYTRFGRPDIGLVGMRRSQTLYRRSPKEAACRLSSMAIPDLATL